MPFSIINLYNVFFLKFLELPTEREMDLWAELQATKETLRMTEEEMNLCKREKMRFLDTLSKITVRAYYSLNELPHAC